ncbi:DNA topoisomerase 2, partial [Symbiodinium microadriaticum]
SWTAWSPFQIPELAAGRADARLEYFEDANEILQAFYRARMPFYELRKEKMQRKMAEKVRRLSNQVRCIRMCQDDTLSFSELCARGLEDACLE